MLYPVGRTHIGVLGSNIFESLRARRHVLVLFSKCAWNSSLVERMDNAVANRSIRT